MKKFYITTSIAYTNAAPHIGFALELCQADVLARYHRLRGDDTYFLTGTWMTLPVYLYGMLRFGLSPEVFAISGFILVISLSLILLMAKYIGKSQELAVRR